MHAIKAFFARIVSFFTSDKLQHRLSQAYDILETVLPIVEQIAAITPTRADDEIVALAHQFLVPFPERPMTEAQKAEYLRNTAVIAVRRTLTKFVPDSVIGLAVELAVNVVKAGKEG